MWLRVWESSMNKKNLPWNVMLFALWSNSTERQFKCLSLPGPQSGVNSEPIFHKLEACLPTQEPCLMWTIVEHSALSIIKTTTTKRSGRFPSLHICPCTVDFELTAKLNLFTVGGLYFASLCEKYVGKNPPILEIWEKEKKHLWLPAQLTHKYMANHPLCQRSAAGGVPHEAKGRSQLRSLVNEAEWSPALPLLYTESTPSGVCLLPLLCLFGWVGV